MRLPRITCLCLTLALMMACTRGGPTDTGTAATSLAASAKATTAVGVKASSSTRDSTVIDFLANTVDCSFGHRGVLLDLGDEVMRSRMSGTRLVTPDVDVREHEGASWVGVRARSLELSFVSPTESKTDAGIVVEARARGGLAKSASVYLNGKPLGTLSFTKGEIGIASLRAPASINRGANELMLRFNGGPRSTRDQLAEIDWIRVGPNDGDAPYSAPTRSDAVTSVSIGGAAKRAVSLRAPGFARCTAFVPSGSVLEGSIGVTGGEAEAEVRVLVDRAEPRVVGSFKLGGPQGPPGFRPMSLPLGDIGTIAGVELVAKSSTKGARVAFAEARVIAPLKTETKPTAEPAAIRNVARGVIMVVMGSMSRRLLALHGGSIQVPEIGALANGGVVFEAHRATSSYASGAVGSMLTGLTPREHGASDADTALSPSVFRVAEAAREAGVVTAMFTANPTTSEPYGFARGWETFVARLPSEESPATTVFEDASRWLDTHKDERFFIVVHARGGHPPWDVTSEELKELPPAGYAGSMEPRHAGEALAKARKVGGGRLFADADRERAFALHGKTIAAHDAALGALAAHVRTMGRDKDTTWIVTSDIGIDAAAHVPFLEEESLEEGALAVPLVIHSPLQGLLARVPTATSGVDVAPTILEAFGLSPPPHLRGESLLSLAAERRPASERPLIAATTTRFSARWGAFAAAFARDREVKVCNLSLDPDCVSDVRPSHPIAAEALRALAWNELVRVGQDARPPLKSSVREPHPDSREDPKRSKELEGALLKPVPAGPSVVADGPTSAALRAWGR